PHLAEPPAVGAGGAGRGPRAQPDRRAGRAQALGPRRARPHAPGHVTVDSCSRQLAAGSRQHAAGSHGPACALEPPPAARAGSVPSAELANVLRFSLVIQLPQTDEEIPWHTPFRHCPTTAARSSRTSTRRRCRFTVGRIIRRTSTA